MKIRDYIIDKSKEINIDIIGFTDASPLMRIMDYLNYRFDDNRYTEFEEKDISRRIDPKLTMPDCKSIIVIALSYNVDFNETPEYKFKGSLSRSSWGIDYHIVMKNKLELLASEISKVKEFNYMNFADTGPLVDRELAHKAGIGYYGKNCSIINEEYGSFIFIGYMLTDLEIEEYDTPKESECGDCDLCLKACPTSALDNPFRLNPRRCVSYITQTKTEIEDDLKKKMGIKIFGCDTCQMVCPKNKNVKKSTNREFIPNITKGAMDLEELLTISNREFKGKYGHMSGSWRGKGVLKRNAKIALNNIKNKNNMDYINKLLKDK